MEYCRITRLASTSAAKSGQGRVMIMWRKWLVLGVLVVLLASSAICEASAAVPLHWMRYTTADGLVSFEYPSGWLVVETESGFMIHDEYDSQQLWLVPLPYQRSWSAKEHADYFLGLLQAENPDVYGGDWQSDQSGDMILMELIYGRGPNTALGYTLIIKDNEYQQALWLHYLAYLDLFDEDRALSILGDFVDSLALMPDYPSPAADDSRMARINRNVDGFLFVLEFSLGNPLSLAEENRISEGLRRIFRGYSDEELTEYDDYPFYAAFIWAMEDQAELADLQMELEAAAWEWVEERGLSDPIISLIRTALLEADNILIPGKAPLTEVAAAAYAELYVFAEHLGSGGAPDLGFISERRVEEVRAQLVDTWGHLTQEEREQVLQLPAVWTALRRAISLGGAQDRAYALQVINSAAPQFASRGAWYADSHDPIQWLDYQRTQGVAKKTFDYFRWSLGYHNAIYGF